MMEGPRNRCDWLSLVRENWKLQQLMRGRAVLEWGNWQTGVRETELRFDEGGAAEG